MREEKKGYKRASQLMHAIKLASGKLKFFLKFTINFFSMSMVISAYILTGSAFPSYQLG